MYAFCVLFVVLGTLQMANAQRNLVMIHGLGGSEGSLKGYQNLFFNSGPDKRQSVDAIVNFTMNTANGVSTAANDAIDQTIQNSPNNNHRSNDIAIAHSLGAVTAREMDRQRIRGGQERMFGGMISLGGVHFGSKFPYKFQDGSFNAFLSSACKEPILDPLAALLGIVPALNQIQQIFGNFGITNSNICNWVAQYGVQQFSGFTTSTINDEKYDSPFLNGSDGLNRFSSATHKIAICGNESSPVHWRVVSSQTFSNAPTGGLGDGTSDQTLVNIMDDLEIADYIIGGVCSGLAIGFAFAPSLWSYIPSLIYAAYECFDGAIWLGRSESYYNELLGANDYIYQPTPFTVITNSCQNAISSIQSSMYNLNYFSNPTAFWQLYSQRQALLNDPNCWQTQWLQVAVPLNGQSDGLATVESQKLPSISTTQSPAVNIVIDGLNHFELRDHPKLTNTLLAIFRGSSPDITHPVQRDFFTTP